MLATGGSMELAINELKK